MHDEAKQSKAKQSKGKVNEKRINITTNTNTNASFYTKKKRNERACRYPPFPPKKRNSYYIEYTKKKNHRKSPARPPARPPIQNARKIPHEAKYREKKDPGRAPGPDRMYDSSASRDEEGREGLGEEHGREITTGVERGACSSSSYGGSRQAADAAAGPVGVQSEGVREGNNFGR